MTVEGFGEAVQRVTNVPIATLAVAYDDPLTHSVYILVFHQALLVPRMKTHLINPLQIRNQGLEVHETLLQHLNPDERLPHSHSVICDEPPLHIPMTLRGTMSGFTVRLPTQEEIDDHEQLNTTWVHMTNDAPWKPYSSEFATIEDSLRSAMDRGTELYYPEPRDLAPLQVRGLDDESKLQGTAELKGTVQVETVSDDDDDGTAATEECTDEESLGEIKTKRELSSVHLSRFASEQRGTAALDVDRYAGSCREIQTQLPSRSAGY